MQRPIGLRVSVADLVQLKSDHHIDASLVDVFREGSRTCQPGLDILAPRVQMCSELIKPSYDVSGAK